MSAVLPRVRQTPTPNYTPVPIRHDLLILHMMEGGYAGSVAWLCQPGARASAHLCMREDGGEVSQLVPLSMKAWAQCALNGRGVSLEMPGFTAQGVPEARWRAAALIFGWLSLAYAIPVRWAEGGQGQGICQHHDLGAAGGGHVDCCGVGSADWTRFLGYVAAARAEFEQMAALPEFLLHGAPNPHQVALPPHVPPTPTHGGAPRVAPGEAPVAHPTTSGHPEGSVADIQYRLNGAGARPQLAVDGYAGPLTRAAIAHFQATHGLAIDGLIGPRTWAALAAQP
jgi:hypothetical protein